MNARRTYLLITFSTALFFTMWSMYTGVYRVAAGLTPLQLVLLGTTLEIAIFFAEVPTGIVADLYSRKWSVIIGLTIIGAGFLLEGALPWVITIFAAQAVWGIGYTFTSGAQDAWLAGEIGEAELGSTMLRGSQFGRIGSLVGMGIAALIALSSSVNFALIAGGVGYLIIALALSLFMPETGFQPA
ncbi:MAG: MFS transporter, partial [Chloroflexota bacterium]